MKGLIIIGSAQVNSHTNALATYLTEHFKTHNIEAEIFDLAENPLNQLDFSGTTPSVDEIKQNIKNLKDK
ncbi:FMN-dependent NADH-azoreductase, partial [Staphylococcus aureus]